MSGPYALVVAKAPVPGLVKTRLAVAVGAGPAAELAAASLLDTLAACRAAFGARRCVIALAGDLADAVRGREIRAAVQDWCVTAQRGDTFAARLSAAHADVPAGGVVQVGMDTPQLGADRLRDVAAALDQHDAVLGPAEDGGWWVLGLREAGAARVLRDVAMSTPTTYDDTRAALSALGLRVGTAATMRDVDDVHDARVVAAETTGEFARAWRAVCA